MKLLFTICLALIISSNLSLAATTQLSASKDNTIYESTLNSNGAGDYFFAGKTGEELSYRIRRSLLMFDLTSIPAEAKILSVTLRLHMSRTKTTTGRTISLHALEQDWGEEDSHAGGQEGGGGSASVGDATWNFAFMRSVSWSTAGGDFSSTASASQTVGATGYYTWGSTEGMVENVQSWVSNESSNFGWLIKGDEVNTSTAKRFDSRTNSVSEYRPLLEIEYEAPDVHISEVFQYPEKEGFPGEFVEIFNAGKIGQKLDGWMLYQPNLQLITVLNEKSLLNGDLILQPGEYAVIGRGSADEFKNLWGFLPDTYFSEGNSSDAGAPQLNDGAYFELWTYNESIKDRYGHSKTFQFSSSRNHYTRIDYPNPGTDLRDWLADTGWGNPGTDNLAPVAVNDNAGVDEDASVKINILDNDSDLDGMLDGSTVQITSDPTSGTITSINAKTGEVSYEPDADYFGSDQFNYTVRDDKKKVSNEASVRISIYSVNDPPVAVDEEEETLEDTAIEIDVLSNDEDIDGALIPATVDISKVPAHGTTSINKNNGIITYTPAENYNGPDSFNYTVKDDSGAVSNAALVTLTVGAENDPPVILRLPVVEFKEDNTLRLALTSLYEYVEDPDTPDENLELKLTGGNNIDISLDGSDAVMTARSNWFGRDTIMLEVSDDQSSDQADMYVIVHSINDAPEINDLPDQLILNTDSTIIIMLWNFVSDVETPDNKLKYSFKSSEDSLNYEYSDVTGTLTLTAIYGLNSDIAFEITVEDDSAATVKHSMTISVETISGLAENFSSGAPAIFGLSQNYPNPFNPSTTIRYQLAEATEVHLEVYNSLGQSVAVLASGRQPAGEYGVMFDTMAYNLASGIYIYQLTAGKFRQTRKMVLMR